MQGAACGAAYMSLIFGGDGSLERLPRARPSAQQPAGGAQRVGRYNKWMYTQGVGDLVWVPGKGLRHSTKNRGRVVALTALFDDPATSALQGRQEGFGAGGVRALLKAGALRGSMGTVPTTPRFTRPRSLGRKAEAVKALCDGVSINARERRSPHCILGILWPSGSAYKRW